MARNTYGEQKLTIEQMHPTKPLAADADHSHYYTGKPCKHGHLSPRTVKDYQCIECQRESARKRKRENYVPHPRTPATPEVKKAKAQTYYQRNRERILEQVKKYRLENKEKIKKQRQSYWQDNKERLTKKRKAYYEANKEREAETSKLYCEKNKDKIRQTKREYYEKNREVLCQKRREYRRGLKREQMNGESENQH